jgi:ABC-2 type transport system permease protein
MPILDIGYRNWSGARTNPWFRWIVLSMSGVQLVWSGSGLRRVMMVSLLPAIFAGLGICLFEQSAQDSEFRKEMIQGPLAGLFMRAEPGSLLATAAPAIENPDQHRHLAWSILLFWYFRYPQALAVVILLGLVAPRLISYDLRSRGYLLYLSRPLSTTGYILGKTFVLLFLIVMTTTLPALLVYFAGLLMSNHAEVFSQTWDIPLRILASTAVLSLPTCAAAVAFSSVTEESRFAGFAWFASWILGWVTFLVLSGSAMQWTSEFQSQSIERSMYFSPYHLLGYLQREIFGLQPTGHVFQWQPWVLVASVTVLGFAITHYRVSRLLRK